MNFSKTATETTYYCQDLYISKISYICITLFTSSSWGDPLFLHRHINRPFVLVDLDYNSRREMRRASFPPRLAPVSHRASQVRWSPELLAAPRQRGLRQRSFIWIRRISILQVAHACMPHARVHECVRACLCATRRRVAYERRRCRLT